MLEHAAVMGVATQSMPENHKKDFQKNAFRVDGIVNLDDSPLMTKQEAIQWTETQIQGQHNTPDFPIETLKEVYSALTGEEPPEEVGIEDIIFWEEGAE